jgi:pyrophosphate--fructose-6-phosphate 1-phosphotransferase
MKDKDLISIEMLLKNPEVEIAASNINQELIERRKYIPPKCDVFTSPYTVLKDNDDFKFTIDREARKQLPDIINNKVQLIVGLDSSEESFKQRYGKKYTLGVVFSGGPSPGGHNVIAGLYDTAKNANSQTRIFGFLLGPDGIIENEAINRLSC